MSKQYDIAELTYRSNPESIKRQCEHGRHNLKHQELDNAWKKWK